MGTGDSSSVEETAMALLRRMIGAVLREVRRRQGRTLRDVAEAAGVSLPYLSEVERGTKEPSSEILAAICRALDLPLADLLDEVRRELRRETPAPRLFHAANLQATEWLVARTAPTEVRVLVG
jgi:transcriptional regulator with XRE-family HTH domain